MSDFKKLCQFAQLLGIPVLFEKGTGGEDAGYFVYKGKKSHIIVFYGKRKKGTKTIVRLLHELGHALHWIEMGRPKPVDLPEYFNKERLSKRDKYDQWIYEREAVRNMRRIHRLLRLELPEWRLNTEMMFDLWVANRFYRSGAYPSKSERRKKLKEIRKRERKLFTTGGHR